MQWSEAIKYVFTSALPAVIVAVVGMLAGIFLERQTTRLMVSRGVPESTASSVKMLIRWTVGVLTFLAFATILGVRLTTVWATVSAVVAMTAVGLFAGWSLISSSLAMVIILVWRPYKVGDDIEILPDGIRGRLKDIDFMFCRIQEQDGRTLVISNSQMLQKMVRQYPVRHPESPASEDTGTATSEPER